TTPVATNEVGEILPRSELFRAHDPSGITMAITAMSVVFSALLCLFLLFKLVGIVLMRMEAKKNAQATGAAPVRQTAAQLDKEAISGEVIAAIATTIRLFEEDLHDKESEIITINRVARTYSPWSSKIYGINNQPVRNK
ncbi:MAG: OadG family protein, partial [Rikenellaceae bacterium]|nr:OadG family protein [Rikenellaceae bacterium]